MSIGDYLTEVMEDLERENEQLKKDNAKLREIIARCQQIIDEYKARQRTAGDA